MTTISQMFKRGVLLTVAGAILGGCSSSSPNALTPSSGEAPAGASSSARSPEKGNFTHYYVVPLGTLGGSASSANSVNDRGWVAGLSKLRGNAVVHATAWINGKKVNLGTLGGPNSAVGWPVKNTRGVLVGMSDLSQTDPFAENFCGFGTTDLCAGFRWKDSVLTPLPTLGGDNSFAAAANDAGAIVGFAENSTQGSSCGAPQVFDYDGVVWKPHGPPVVLTPLSGDAVSQAVAINNSGESAGASGPCGPPNNLGYGTAHALLWNAYGQPTDLGSLGGTTANLATAVNDDGQVVGQSALSGNTTYHAFYYDGSMSDMGVLPGDALSEALGLNRRGEAVGYSCDSSGNCRGFVWQDGMMSDLNQLVPSSGLTVVYAGDVNDRGWIVGQALDRKTGRAPAVLLIPTGSSGGVNRSARNVVLPQRVRHQLLLRRSFRPFIR